MYCLFWIKKDIEDISLMLSYIDMLNKNIPKKDIIRKLSRRYTVRCIISFLSKGKESILISYNRYLNEQSLIEHEKRKFKI